MHKKTAAEQPGTPERGAAPIGAASDARASDPLPPDHRQLVDRQFGATAAAYLTSSVHATGADLDDLAALAAAERPPQVLDLGCGAGHVSFALARGGAGRVVAYDLSAEMLGVVAAEALARGHANVETRTGSAESLPFAASSFDWIVSRYSAHHWLDLPRALAAAARVLVPGGRLIAIDVVAPEAPLLDTVLQALEILRDASHVRNYRISEWRQMLTKAGFGAPSVHGWKLPLEFNSWVRRIATPPERVLALKSVIKALPAEAREYFRIDAEFGFATDCAWIEARKAG
ncbi:MAG: methyltransferase domain-containing protein [Steroidobacteraceae bacterium]|jgi:ubiquinone/menaquinone biosynthesis C-methylase UbiE